MQAIAKARSGTSKFKFTPAKQGEPKMNMATGEYETTTVPASMKIGDTEVPIGDEDAALAQQRAEQAVAVKRKKDPTIPTAELFKEAYEQAILGVLGQRYGQVDQAE